MGLTTAPRKNELHIALPHLSTFSVHRLGSADFERRCNVGTGKQMYQLVAGMTQQPKTTRVLRSSYRENRTGKYNF